MKNRILIAGVVAAVALGGGLAAMPASAAPAKTAAVAQHRPQATGLVDDVYLYHPRLRSVLQTPPLNTLIRFRTEALTNHIPNAISIVVHLLRWRSAIQLHRPRGAWVEIHPTVKYGRADLPPPGTHDYLKPPADWTCETGRFYVRVHVSGIDHTGKPASTNLDFPWARFSVKHPHRGNVHKPPALKQAWRTECQGNDALSG